MCVIRIGTEENEYLTIEVSGRSHPDCTDFWDGNWLRAKVEVASGGFRGRVSGDLRAEEFSRFYEELSRLRESLRGTAGFATLEGWLSIRVVGDGRGHMRFECRIMDQPGIGNFLTCTFDLDQTFLEPTLLRLRETLDRYPVIGEVPTRPLNGYPVIGETPA
jgi:hypothetical protein